MQSSGAAARIAPYLSGYIRRDGLPPAESDGEGRTTDGADSVDDHMDDRSVLRAALCKCR